MSELSNAANSAAQDRALAAIREDAAPKALVHADKSGRWFHVYCQSCELRGQAAKDKALIQARADDHNLERHGGSR